MRRGIILVQKQVQQEIIFFHVRSKYGKKFDSNVRKIKRKRRKESFNSGKVAEDCVSMPSCDHHVSGVCSSW